MKKYLIIGGTGTLGHALLDKLPHAETAIFSRDELKQQQLKKSYPQVTTYVGDIRDKDRLRQVISSNQIIYHVAALKHVDVLEHCPEEAYKTNVLGTQNIADVAEEMGAKKVLFTSTDKAVLPINAYGYSKAMAEKILLARNESSAVDFLSFRWGNIVGSRGSVISYFLKTLIEEHKVYITDAAMTRFWMRIEDAVDFMLYGNHDLSCTNYPKMKSSKVTVLARAIAELIDIPYYDVEIIGLRPGEKIHECMDADINLTSENARQFSLNELKKLLKPIVEKLKP